MKIKKITKEKFSGYVYNLGVAEDMTYFANGILVHNCRSTLVPITKFESYRVDREISIENLKKLGGHLL